VFFAGRRRLERRDFTAFARRKRAFVSFFLRRRRRQAQTAARIGGFFAFSRSLFSRKSGADWRRFAESL
jgi:hypothetical protein